MMPTNFLWYSGTTPYQGLTAPSVTLMSTEATTLGSSVVVLSSSGPNLNGVYTSSLSGQSVWGEVFFTCASTFSGTPLAGGNIAGWFIPSYDGGTTYESTNQWLPAPPRAPDFIIPFSTTVGVVANSIYKANGMVRFPALTYKVAIQNNLGVAIGSTNTLKIAPIALQY